ncbi:MAG: radical SAM protein [Desulfatibacillum sp.]|nr:radical SAM protein [Desulfatibacillum sp.]
MSPLDPPIKGVEFQSDGHWSGMPCANVFLAYCNLRCPWCNAGQLVLEPHTLETLPLQVFFSEIEAIRQEHPELKAVCFTGGEPTMHRGLPDLIRQVGDMGLATCLETNGTQPHMLDYLITNGILKYILLDLKAPLDDESYSKAVGVPMPASIIRESLGQIKKMQTGHFIRTTVVPGISGEKEVPQMALQIKEMGFSRLDLNAFDSRQPLDPVMAHTRPYQQEEIKRLQGAADAIFS